MAFILSQILSTCVATALIALLSSFIWHRRRAVLILQPLPDEKRLDVTLTLLIKNLAEAFLHSLILPHDAISFKRATNAYWAKQETEVQPACIFQPKDFDQLCEGVTILKTEYDERRKSTAAE